MLVHRTKMPTCEEEAGNAACMRVHGCVCASVCVRQWGEPDSFLKARYIYKCYSLLGNCYGERKGQTILGVWERKMDGV